MDCPAESRHRVLLVDDAAEVRDVLGRILSKHFQVTPAASGEEGREILSSGAEYAVVVSDHVMPGMSGTSFLEWVGKEHPDATRVMLTALPDPNLPVEALHQSGIHRFLTKPCSTDELIEAVRSGVERYEERKETEIVADELAFSNESLLDLNCTLEDRISTQRKALQCMHRFAVELNQVEGLHDIARASARAVHDTLGERGVHVQIWDPEEVKVEHNMGPEMSAQMHSEPLRTSAGQVGVIVIDELDAFRRRLTGSDLDMLAAIASTTAVAAHNEFRRRELDDAQYATIVALARLSEQRDNETGKHLDRVSRYCKLVAEGLRARGLHDGLITDAWIRDLVYSAPLHDIGKVGIPDSILLKPGKLTPEEWEIMKTHAELGATTMDRVIRENRSRSYLSMGRDIAWCHHEKWDGSGYPRGLVGEEIPLPARILALADVYDALTSVRPYKDAWTHEEAMTWIVDGRGTHFDPDVVDAFNAAREEADEIRERLADRKEDLELKAIWAPVRRSA